MDLPLMLSVPEVGEVLGISRAGAYELVRSKGHCWPSLHTISRVTGIAVSTVKNRIDYLAKWKLISISTHAGKSHYKNNVYTMLPWTTRKYIVT